MKKYFTRALTSAGEVNLTDENLSGLKKTVKISGGGRREKTKIFAALAEYAAAKGKQAELILSPYPKGFSDGVIIKGCAAAVCEELTSGGEVAIALPYSEAARALEEKKNGALATVFEEYAEAKKIHDEWEKIYINAMDFESLTSFADLTVDCMIKTSGSEAGKRTGRFFGASAPEGAVSLIPQLTKYCARRFFIKGRPGTGKSTFLKKLARRAEEAGFDTEAYYCSFDKNSLDMVIVPSLSLAVFDSTPPHEHFPDRPEDTVLDFYAESRLMGTDEHFREQLEDVKKRYALKMAEGRAALLLAQRYAEEQEHYLAAEAVNTALAAEKLISAMEI